MQPESQTIVAVIADDHFQLESLCDFIEAMGIDCIAYLAADAFLKSGDLHRVHCVLTDLRMPG